jgi:hypothetical protein
MPWYIISLRYYFIINLFPAILPSLPMMSLTGSAYPLHGQTGALFTTRLFEGRISTRLGREPSLAPDPVPAQLRVMFTVSESDAEAIRRAYEAGGELSGVVELRRHFPGITDTENAQRCARANAGWTPLPRIKSRRTCRIKP